MNGIRGIYYELAFAFTYQEKTSQSLAPPAFGEPLFEWKKNDFSQAEAALKLRISTRTLQELEHARARPRHLVFDAVEALIKS